MKSRKKSKNYHHGDLAESLLEAVDHIARRFGLEAVTLRACAKLLGVAPSAGFRHYADKRALFTAFATRAQHRMAGQMSNAAAESGDGDRSFLAVALAYIEFALDEPAAFQVMWRSEMIYVDDPDYRAASEALSRLFRQGFAETLDDENKETLNERELLAWSVVHGLASLFTDGPLLSDADKSEKLERAEKTLGAMIPALGSGG